jgi:cytochrome P450
VRTLQSELSVSPSTVYPAIGSTQKTKQTECALLFFSSDKDSEKPFIYACFSRIGGYHNIASRPSSDSLWKAARKGSAPAFSSREVGRMNAVCQAHLEKWMDDTAKDELVFDPSQEMIRLTFFIIMESAFEYAATPEEYISFVADLQVSLLEFMFRQVVNPLRRLFGVFLPETRRAVRACRRCRAFAQRILDVYRSNPHKSTEYNTLIRVIDENPAFAGNDKLKVSELLMYMIGGFDSTGYSISSTLVLLSQHPEVVQKARDSMISMGADDEANHNSTEQMTDAIRHILAESNRLYPVAAMGSIRSIARDITVLDRSSQRHYLIRKGSNCFLPQYLANRNPTVYGPDADTFRPARWEHASPDMHESRLTFALGQRNCIAQSLALAELHTVLPRLIARYNFELIEPGRLDYCMTLKVLDAKIKMTKVDS